mmetsp:Transcript_9310/g.29011  ORF Transcript_9310/g.29011 Transcript_9310/m.29011 type:complete len:216 (-) Transcript_9310:364-1011(-)
MTATTGARGGWSLYSEVASRSSSVVSSPRRSGRAVSTPTSAATSSATSMESSAELSDAMSSWSSTRRRRSAGTPKSDASSRSVAASGRMTGPSRRAAAFFCSSCCCARFFGCAGRDAESEKLKRCCCSCSLCRDRDCSPCRDAALRSVSCRNCSARSASSLEGHSNEKVLAPPRRATRSATPRSSRSVCSNPRPSARRMRSSGPTFHASMRTSWW